MGGQTWNEENIICPNPYYYDIAPNNNFAFSDDNAFGYFICGNILMRTPPPYISQINNYSADAPLIVTANDNLINLRGDNYVLPFKLKIFNAIGQFLFEKEIQTVNETVPVQYEGLVLYQIQKNNKIIQSGKLIIK